MWITRWDELRVDTEKTNKVLRQFPKLCGYLSHVLGGAVYVPQQGATRLTQIFAQQASSHSSLRPPCRHPRPPASLSIPHHATAMNPAVTNLVISLGAMQGLSASLSFVHAGADLARCFSGSVYCLRYWTSPMVLHAPLHLARV